MRGKRHSVGTFCKYSDDFKEIPASDIKGCDILGAYNMTEQRLSPLARKVLTGTPREVAAACKQVAGKRSTEMELALACRYRGIEYVKALVENGGKFRRANPKKKSVKYWLALPDYNTAIERNVFGFKGYEVYADKIKMRDEKDGRIIAIYKKLSLNQRVEIALYLCKKSERVNFYPSELLYYSIMSNCKELTAALKGVGVSLSEQRIAMLTTNGQTNGQTNGWNEFCDMYHRLNTGEFLDVMRNIVKETGGKTLRFSRALWLKYYTRFNLTDPEILGFILDNFDQTRMNKKFMMMFAIEANNPELLAIFAKHGWLARPSVRDEMIEWASDSEKTECIAWLLDYKTRNFDLEAEREKAERTARRKLNAAPDSVTALRELFRWRKQEDGTLIITSYKGGSTEIEVPSKIGQSTVTVIGKYAFSFLSKRVGEWSDSLPRISAVRLPDSIRRIDEKAFAGCDLTKMDIPGNVAEIGEGAFHWCMKLTEVNLSSGIVRIGDEAFYKCVRLSEVVIPDSVTQIGYYAFSDCDALKTVVIPASVKEIEADWSTIFEGSENVTAVVEPGSYAEEYCKRYNIPFRHGTADALAKK